MNQLKISIEQALCDPDAPWYGSDLVPMVADMLEENERLRAALQRIERWRGEFPETGRFWDDESGEPMSYSACYGSNGERDFMRGIAREALRKVE